MCYSVAIHQDVSGNARERAFALGVAIGSGYLYETNFKKEVLSDLTGERGTLMGAIQGLYHPPTLTPRTGTPRHPTHMHVRERTHPATLCIPQAG